MNQPFILVLSNNKLNHVAMWDSKDNIIQNHLHFANKYAVCNYLLIKEEIHFMILKMASSKKLRVICSTEVVRLKRHLDDSHLWLEE